MATAFLGNIPVFGLEDYATLGTSKFFAENGLIHMENRVTGEYKVVSIREAQRKVEAIKMLVGTQTRPGLERDPEDRRKMMLFITTMEHQVFPKAREQGDINDPTCYASRIAALPKSFSFARTLKG